MGWGNRKSAGSGNTGAHGARRRTREKMTLSIAASSLTFPTRNIASPGIVHPREVELLKASVFLDQLPISVQFSALTHVADEIRVHAGVVLAAALRVESPYQGPCAHLCGDEDLVPLPSTDRVVHQDSCKFADPLVSHRWLLFSRSSRRAYHPRLARLCVGSASQMVKPRTGLPRPRSCRGPHA